MHLMHRGNDIIFDRYERNDMLNWIPFLEGKPVNNEVLSFTVDLIRHNFFNLNFKGFNTLPFNKHHKKMIRDSGYCKQCHSGNIKLHAHGKYVGELLTLNAGINLQTDTLYNNADDFVVYMEKIIFGKPKKEYIDHLFNMLIEIGIQHHSFSQHTERLLVTYADISTLLNTMYIPRYFNLLNTHGYEAFQREDTALKLLVQKYPDILGALKAHGFQSEYYDCLSTFESFYRKSKKNGVVFDIYTYEDFFSVNQNELNIFT